MFIVVVVYINRSLPHAQSIHIIEMCLKLWILLLFFVLGGSPSLYT